MATGNRQAGLLAVPLIERLLATAMARGADFAEVYVERNEFNAVALEEGAVKSAQNGLSQGVGVRVIAGPRVGYAYSDDLDDEALLRAAQTAADFKAVQSRQHHIQNNQRRGAFQHSLVSAHTVAHDVAGRAAGTTRADTHCERRPPAGP